VKEKEAHLVVFEAAGLMPRGDFWSIQVFCSCYR